MMKRVATSFALFYFSCLTCNSHAQSTPINTVEGSGTYPLGLNDAAHPCVSAEEYRQLEQQGADNQKALGLAHAGQRKTTATSLSWPLRLAAGLTDCSFYSISAYVDQDTAMTAIRDWNCGTTTYDGHKGTDIFTFPYPFYKMDHNEVEVIAAAPGMIVSKTDGNVDKNCAANSLTANSIVVQHADGSWALYLHMKNGSLTAKTIGNTVATGEYLGVVGSSGNATGPHLHFEVWNGSTVATRRDPFSGSCNSLNAASWWAAQPPYKNPSVIKATVNHAQAVLPPCPATETPNEDPCFAVGTLNAYFYVFFKDETVGMTATMSIVNASNAVISSWTLNSTVNGTGTYHYWTKPLPTTAGVYTFKAVYNGLTCSKTFKMDCSTGGTGVGSVKSGARLLLSPNPVIDKLLLSGAGMPAGTYRLRLRNILGQEVYAENRVHLEDTFQTSISLSHLPGGVYFLTLESGTWQTVRRLVKQ